MTSQPAGLPYVSVIRHFRELTDAPKDGMTRRMLRHFATEKLTTWHNLLRPYAGSTASAAVVLVAPSGAGKSTEVEQAAERLRRDGYMAFLGEAGAVATDGLHAALDPQSVAAFEKWQSGTAPAVLFLDAMDEVYLRQRKFRDVTRRLARDVDFGTRDVQVILTARNGAWLASDRSDLMELLRTSTPAARIMEVTFEPIDQAALAALAAAAGVQDVEEFLRCFEEDELYDLLDLRPCDVPLFANYWNKHGVFGSWTQILADFVDASLIEANPAHQPRQCLSLANGIAALRRISAASVLTKQPHITLPTSAPLPGAMDGRKLFADWEGRLLGELFANGLFVHKGEAAVQLPQGALTHYLASKWFADRLHKGWRTEDLRSALVVQVFNERRWRVPMSRFQVLGWVASELPELRKLLLQDDPLVALYEGDPRRLTTQEISEGLRRVVRLAVDHGGAPWATKGTIRQLARPELDGVVLKLLVDNRGTLAAERILLRYVELGRYHTCVPHALAIAGDSAADVGSRAAAIAAVGGAGSAEDIGALFALLGETVPTLRAELVQVLLPDVLRGEALVQFLLIGGGHEVNYYIGRVIDRVNREDVALALQRLAPLLTTRTVTKETKHHHQLAVTLLLSWMRKPASGLDAPWLGDVILGLERHSDVHFILREESEELVTLLGQNMPARRAAWRARLLRTDEPYIRPRLGAVQAEDLSWLFEQFATAPTDVARNEIRWAIDAFYQSLSNEQRVLVAEQPGLADDLRSRFQSLDAHAREQQARQRERAEVERRSADEVLRKNIETLSTKKDALEQGEDWGLLSWALQNVDHLDTARARLDLGQLRELVGEEMSQAFERGFRACWRRQQVPLPEPGGNSRPYVLIAGLTGLTLQIRDGLDLSSFSGGEADLAARYALHELNGFPYWLDDLRAAQPNAVRTVLEQALEREWLANCEYQRILEFASRAPKGVSILVRSILLRLLETHSSASPKMVRNAADVLLVSRDDTPRVAALVHSLVVTAKREDLGIRCAWLRVWVHIDPTAAADWLENVRRDTRDDFEALLAALLPLLDEDFRHHGQSSIALPMGPAALERWVRLLHQVAPPDQDRMRNSAFGPGMWRGCLDRLAEDVSMAAYHAMQRLRQDVDLRAARALVEHAAEAQAVRAAESAASAWLESDIIAVEDGDERQPRSPADLFQLVRRHLGRVAELVEKDDFSYRALFNPGTPEKEIQRWVASSLKLVSRGLYSIVRENEFDDDKQVDISALAESVARLPIEIKPLGSYSLNELTACVSSQLYGKYMKPTDVKYGVLLLVRQDQKKKWTIGGRLEPFPALVDAVRAFAADFGVQHDKVIAVEVVDLVAPT